MKSSDVNDLAESIGVLASMVAEQFDRVTERFDQIDRRFETVDQRFEQIDQRFDQIDQRFDRVDQRFDQMDRRLGKIETEQIATRRWIESIDSRLMGVESDIAEIYDQIVVLSKKGKKNLTPKDKKELEEKLNTLIAWAKEVSRYTGIALPKL